MKKKTLVVSGAALASAAAVAVGGAAFASAGNAPAEAGQYGYAAPGYSDARGNGGDGGRGEGHGRGPLSGRAGQGLSGETAVKVVEAAVAKEPTATLLRLGKADDGTYRVAMRRTDGTRVVLTLDADFAVTGAQEQGAGPQHGPKPSSNPSRTTSTPTPSSTT